MADGAIDFGFRPGIQIGSGGLKEWPTGRGHRKSLIELFSLLLAHRISKPVSELFEGERNSPVTIGRVAENRPRGFERGKWQRQHTAEWRRVDGHSDGRPASAREDLRSPPNERPMIAGFFFSPVTILSKWSAA